MEIQHYSLSKAYGERFTGRVEFIREQRGFCLSVRELNDALLWLTSEGSPGTIEVQSWLSTLGLPHAQAAAFGERWKQQLEKTFAA